MKRSETSLDAMLDEAAQSSTRYRMSRFEKSEPKKFDELMDFMVKANRSGTIEFEAACDVWESRKWPLPCSRIHLRRMVNARARVSK